MNNCHRHLFFVCSQSNSCSEADGEEGDPGTSKHNEKQVSNKTKIKI